MSRRRDGRRVRRSDGPRASGPLLASLAAVAVLGGAGLATLSWISVDDGFAVVDARIARDPLFTVQHGGGRISKVYAVAGSTVVAGELLASVEASEVDRRIDALKAEAVATQLRLDAVKREAKAFDFLQQQQLVRRSRVEALEKQVLDLEQQAAGMLSSVEETDDRLGLIEIRAPVAGIVRTMHGLVAGREIRPGETLAEIGTLAGSVILECPLSPRDARAAKIGTPVRVWLGHDWRDGAVAVGRLTSVQPQYDGPRGVTRAAYIARVEVANAAGVARELERPGARMTASIGVGPRPALKQLIQPLRRLAAWPALHGFGFGVMRNG